MAKRKQVRKSKQIIFWVNPDQDDHAKVFEIIEALRRRNKNLSEFIRYGILLAEAVRTGNVHELRFLLPPEMREKLTERVEIERRVEVQPVIVEVNLSDYASPQQVTRSRHQEVKLKGEFEVEDAPIDNTIGDNIDQGFEDFF